MLATLGVIIIFAGCFRAQLVNKRPYLSTDTYRYIWDGRVQAAGIKPVPLRSFRAGAGASQR